MRFLLVNPTSPLWRARAAGRTRGARPFRFSMLTSLYVAAAMPPGVRTRILDEDAEPVDFDAEADLVGVSSMTYNARAPTRSRTSSAGAGAPSSSGRPTALPMLSHSRPPAP